VAGLINRDWMGGLDDEDLVEGLETFRREIARRAGTYRYLCRIGTILAYAHQAVGEVVADLDQKGH